MMTMTNDELYQRIKLSTVHERVQLILHYYDKELPGILGSDERKALFNWLASAIEIDGWKTIPLAWAEKLPKKSR